MERENNKRGREEEEEEEGMKTKDKNIDKVPLENISKRQNLDTQKHHEIDIKNRDDVENNEDERLGLGVFDFPWREESMINAISEEWCFEDSFFFSLTNNTCTSTLDSDFPDQRLSESAKTFIESIDFPPDKFEETVWSSKKEGVDCT
ncbi:hypothetical protein M5689_014668 [Euphorbia peplus]|nr:hypothetical protein M5689_014668 [Euphorbia peplus]